MNFVHLNIKSGYSFLNSTLKISDIVAIGSKNNYQYLSLTDNNAMFGTIEFIKECEKHSIKPIIGMEVSLGEDNGLSYPLVLLAKSLEGYQNLCRLTNLVSKGDLKNDISYTELGEFSNGIIAILPTSRSYFAKIGDSEYEQYFGKLTKIFNDFYLGLEFYNDYDILILDRARVVASKFNLKTTVITETLTENKKGLYYLDVLDAIDQGTTLEKIVKKDRSGRYFRSEDELLRHFSLEELKSTVAIAESCVFDVYDSKGELVKYPLPENISAEDYLKALCYKGLEKRLKGKILSSYKKRLDYELDVITKMNFANYFLVVWDYVKFAKQNGIVVGPGRGSAAGSLVSYVLGITNVDPIRYNLLFERFLNPERISMPDIDVDFIDSRRDEVVEYLCRKYSLDRTAHVVAFQTFKARSCLRDVGKVLGLSLGEINDISKKVPRMYGDYELEKLIEKSPSFKALMNAKKIYRDIYEVALHIEGLPRQTTLHAAGVVVSDKNLFEVAPIYRPSLGVSTTQYDMHYLEDFGLLKMDILGLTNLSILDDCKKMIKEIYKEDIDLNSLPLDDKNIYSLIASNKTAGIFQMESPGMNRAIKTVKPSSFEDIVALLALFRPGPMNSLKNYADRKHGLQSAEYITPELEEILKDTYGIIIYQEQVIQILVKMAGFSLGKADIVRRAISKKDEGQLASIKSDFISGCIKNKIANSVAEKVYELILQFANYGFNRAHSVSYSMIVAQMGYLKYYYPEIFYTAILNTFGDEHKIVDYYSEIKNTKIKILLPFINKASDHFMVENQAIRFSLASIKDFTPGAMRVVLSERKKKPFDDFCDFVVRCYNQGVNETHINALIDAGAFDEFGDSRTSLKAFLSTAIQYAQIISSVVDGQITFDVKASEKPKIKSVEQDYLLEIENEKKKLGVFISAFPLEYEREKLRGERFKTIKEALQEDGQVKIVAYISYARSIKTKKGDYMAHLKGMDETGEINITVFPKEYSQYELLLRRGNYLQILGNLETHDELSSLLVKQVKIYPMSKGAK